MYKTGNRFSKTSIALNTSNRSTTPSDFKFANVALLVGLSLAFVSVWRVRKRRKRSREYLTKRIRRRNLFSIISSAN